MNSAHSTIVTASLAASFAAILALAAGCSGLDPSEQVVVPSTQAAVPSKVYFTSAGGGKFARLKPRGIPYSTGPDVELGDPLINACEDLDGAAFPVGCTMGALSCTCTVTVSNCVENSSGNCDCDYTLNPTASNCH